MFGASEEKHHLSSVHAIFPGRTVIYERLNRGIINEAMECLKSSQLPLSPLYVAHSKPNDVKRIPYRTSYNLHQQQPLSKQNPNQQKRKTHLLLPRYPLASDSTIASVEIKATMASQPPTNTNTSDNTTQNAEQDEQPWHVAFPAPRLTADTMPATRAQMILSMKIASMLIIDVRRTDYEGGAIRGSLNIPAQGFWWNRGIL